MTTYVVRNGELVEKGLAEPSRSLHIISDSMDYTWHPATGKYVGSKSRFRQMTKDAGCIEVGTAWDKDKRPRPAPPMLDRQQRARDIKTAIEQLQSGR